MRGILFMLLFAVYGKAVKREERGEAADLLALLVACGRYVMCVRTA